MVYTLSADRAKTVVLSHIYELFDVQFTFVVVKTLRQFDFEYFCSLVHVQLNRIWL